MFVFKPILLFLAVSLPFGSAAPADNAVPVARAFSHDELANITGRGVTTNPAVKFDYYGTTSCGDYQGYELQPDATCFLLPGEAIDIVQFYGNCRFSRFAHTNYHRNIRNS